MRHIFNTSVIFLIVGSLVFPLSIRAEDNLASSAVASVLGASITAPANNATIQTGVATTFTASATGGEPPYAYTWDFGDGTTAFGQSYSKTYSTAGVKTVALKVTDFAGHIANVSINVTIAEPVVIPPLTASINTPANNATIQTGVATTFTASATGGEPPYAYTWDFGDGTTAFGQSYSKTYAATGAKTVQLKVTDFASRTAISTLSLTIVNPPPPPLTPVTPTPTTTPTSTPPTPPEPVTPGPSPVVSLTISNIRVTDLTYNGAIVRWTTNLPASSRVIYDIVSHSSIIGQSAPNFGYASSTATTDVDTKVIEHVVSITNLSSSTTYYFRVLSQ